MALALHFMCIIDELMKKNLPLIVTVSALLLVSVSARAQRRTLKGFIKDSATQQPIANVFISDAFARIITRTDDKGYFVLDRKEGQTLFFDAPKYQYDTLRLATMTPDTVTLYMSTLANELAAITISTKGYSKYQQDSLKRRQAFVDDAGPKTPTFAKSNTDAGFALNLDPIIEKKERNRKHAYKSFDEIEQTNYIDYRFPRALVASYTGLKDDALSDFIEKNRPTYKWLRAHTTDDDVFYYINDKLKAYMKKKH